jgi:hypothetical protein
MESTSQKQSELRKLGQKKRIMFTLKFSDHRMVKSVTLIPTGMDLRVRIGVATLTKREVLADIMYELKMKDAVELEADGRSFTVLKRTEPKVHAGFNIIGTETFIYCKSANECRSAISKLGKEVIQL